MFLFVSIGLLALFIETPAAAGVNSTISEERYEQDKWLDIFSTKFTGYSISEIQAAPADSPIKGLEPSTKNEDAQKIKDAFTQGDKKILKLLNDAKQFIAQLANSRKTREQIAKEMIEWWSTVDEGSRRDMSSRFSSFNALEYRRRKIESENE